MENRGWPITASQVASFLDARLEGDDVTVTEPCPLDAVRPGALVFAKHATDGVVASLNGCRAALALVGTEFEGKLKSPHVIVPNPRLAFARAVTEFFGREKPTGVAPTAVVDPGASIDPTSYIGHHSVVGRGVQVGPGTEIRNHVVLAAGTQIGSRTLIKSHAVIGEEGFGFELDEARSPVRIPHSGNVVIGDDVEVGAGCVIARGTLGPTVIGDRVKIDDHVFIAHNVAIGEDSLVIANAEISGSAKIGRRCWIGPSAAIINGASVGDDAFVGIGAVVVKNVEAGAIVAGNPARFMRRRYH